MVTSEELDPWDTTLVTEGAVVLTPEIWDRGVEHSLALMHSPQETIHLAPRHGGVYRALWKLRS